MKGLGEVRGRRLAGGGGGGGGEPAAALGWRLWEGVGENLTFNIWGGRPSPHR